MAQRRDMITGANTGEAGTGVSNMLERAALMVGDANGSDDDSDNEGWSDDDEW